MTRKGGMPCNFSTGSESRSTCGSKRGCVVVVVVVVAVGIVRVVVFVVVVVVVVAIVAQPGAPVDAGAQSAVTERTDDGDHVTSHDLDSPRTSSALL